MKIIVTGGAGFIGSYLCQSLLDDGNKVLCIDNLLKGDFNLKKLESYPNFEFLNYDVINPLPKDLTADQVYHLASPCSPNYDSPINIHKLPFETMAVNTTGTWYLCEFSVNNKAKFLFASTSEAYGEPLEHPQNENYRGNVSINGPRSIYDEAKRFGETITAAFVRSKDLDGRIIRIFNTYGPNMAIDDGRVVIEFVKAALQNKPIPIFGDGKQTRSFCFVTDLVKGLILAMNDQNSKGEIYNLGNPQEFTILELAERIKKLTKSSSEISFVKSLPKDDPTKRCPDISKAKKQLNWQPSVNLDEGLELMIKYVKDQLM